LEKETTVTEDSTLDSITVEVIRHSILASAQEMARNLCRTAYNTVVYEIHDYGIGIHDADGNVVADTPGIAIFTGANDFGVQNTVRFLGRDSLRPGDVYLLNYPYWSCAHTLDALVFAPVFSEGELIAFASCRVHLLDLKAKDAGYVLDSTDMFQEGIFFPGVKVFDEGRVNDDLLNIIRFNSRMPERTIGDLLAQASAVQTGDRQVRQIAKKFGRDAVVEAMKEINDHGERLARAALATLPKGTWSAIDYCDTDGIDLDELVKMEVEVTISDDAMIVDWTKTDKPAPRAVDRRRHDDVQGPHYARFAGVRRELPPSRSAHHARLSNGSGAAHAYVHPLARAARRRGDHQSLGQRNARPGAGLFRRGRLRRLRRGYRPAHQLVLGGGDQRRRGLWRQRPGRRRRRDHAHY
jgi:Hydantoinase B/oxoprolinase